MFRARRNRLPSETLWNEKSETEVAASKWDWLAEKAVHHHREGNSTPL